MLLSFFPRPKPFFISVLLWTLVTALFWHTSLHDLVSLILGISPDSTSASGGGIEGGSGSDSGFASLLRLIALLVFIASVAALYRLLWLHDRQALASRPRYAIALACVWAVVAFIIWNFSYQDIIASLGFDITTPDPPVIGLGFFITADFIAFYIYYALIVALFAGFWFSYAPHKWQVWSVLGSALILFSTYYSVQVYVAINNWRRPFFDLVQNALTGEGEVTASILYGYIISFANIAFLAIFLFAMIRFLTSHYAFRWRTAMNDYYLLYWKKLRHVEGASQRIQEDTKRFAQIMEDLGTDVVEAVLTLVAFLPILLALSVHIVALPIIGVIPQPLFWTSLFWSIFGTLFLAVVAVKLPGLFFRNQRVEAAFRKELVYGEDDSRRAKPPTVSELFANVRRNYFRLFFHYMYFNLARNLYFQADNIFGYFILIPTIAAGAITLGLIQQVLTAFSQVSMSFQLVVSKWAVIVELMSIFKRLTAFEAVLENKPLPAIDQEFLAGSDSDN
ncbi:MAG: peptide antibiotic transporter SbmA [Proteobacteria bacterium]|nr:peptide antibiotic transporter SbmA [Pseudomonadota bacterium]